jgi:hypothetical protein
MGEVDSEYIAALDACVFRLRGAISSDEVLARSLAAATQYPSAVRLWDISEASFEGWTEDRLHALVRGLAPSASTAPNMHIALVSKAPAGEAICRTVQRLVGASGLPMFVEVFPNRTEALEWLGIMHVPIGRGQARARHSGTATGDTRQSKVR